MQPKVSIAYFISSHGFGHAARAAAVINAIHKRWPYIYAELFTMVPEWFFKDSLEASFRHHRLAPDIGMVQHSPLAVDIDATIARLDEIYPLPDREVKNLAARLIDRKCRLVISDISPWGIVVARKAGIPSLLIENFTWDWVYEAFLPQDHRLDPHVKYLRGIFADADHRIQAVPWCAPFSGACLQTPPISRKPVTDRTVIRDRLGLGSKGKMVLITMGGVPDIPRFIENLAGGDKDIHIVVPAAFSDVPAEGRRVGNITLLPHRSAFYHPDLVNAADAVVGKAGYSTLAEVYHSDVPYGYVCRSNYRESLVLETFIKEKMRGLPITPVEFESGAWIEKLPELQALPANPPQSQNGAEVAADYICRVIAGCHDLLEVIDEKGKICGAAPRREVHGNNALLHRVVHVLVFDSQNRLLLQKRSTNKRVAPGKWDTSVGGHVDCGETIETAMLREMEEELGINSTSPEFAYQYIHSNDFESELVFTFACRFDGEPRFNQDEIDAVTFWDLPEIEANLGKGLFSDNFEHEFSLYRQWSA